MAEQELGEGKRSKAPLTKCRSYSLKQVLDIGAQNLLAPMVSWAEDARAVPEAVH